MSRPAVRQIKCPVLTPAKRQKRLQWAMDYRNMTIEEDWSKVIFSDETMIEIQPH